MTQAKPTRVRYVVLAFVCALAMVTYLDRACMGSAKGWMVQSLGLNGPEDLGWVFGAFGLAYAIFEIPTGWLGDRFGPRKTLIRIVLWWSLFTAITGMIGLHVGGGYILGGLGVLVVIRFLFGMGEAGAFPNITRALHNWFPFHQRGFTQGAVWMSGRLMGGLTPLVWAAFVPAMDDAGKVTFGEWRWRMAFWLFGAVGVVWCILFALWFRNRPEECPAVNEAELAEIHGNGADRPVDHLQVPWLRIFTNTNLWVLGGMYFAQSFGWYFYMTYLQGYMALRYNVAKDSLWVALAEGGPLYFGAVGCIVGGLLTDWLIRRTGNRRLGRKFFGILGHGLTALCFLACPYMPGPISFFIVISLSGVFTDLTMGSSWAGCQDIGRRYAAIVAGFMNTIGNVGGALGPVVTGYALKWAKAANPGNELAGKLDGYTASFYLFAAAFAIGTTCWCFFDATKSVDQER